MTMQNARDELLRVLANLEIEPSAIRCASIKYNVENPDAESWDEYVMVPVVLPLEHSPEEAEAFLQALDFEYYSGHGAQNLFGTVWLTFGRWLERGEYDGSEWWDVHAYPDIPESLQRRV
jgi:hypothetical protein